MMPRTILAVAAAAALVAACDRDPPQTPTSGTTSSSGPSQSNTPSTPANIPGKATSTEKSVPAQGQVDAREPEQRRDFEKKGN